MLPPKLTALVLAASVVVAYANPAIVVEIALTRAMQNSNLPA